jgi:2-dehydro-3-deoxygluconokinase
MKKKILAFGEVMLRIGVTNYQLLEQTHDARLSFTGTGLNVLSGLAHLDHETFLLTQLPANRVGEAAKSDIRKLGISDECVKLAGQHIGIYILEQGFGNRPSEVTYLDRLNSSFNQSTWTEAELEQAVQQVDLVHVCGIGLLLTTTIRETIFTLLKLAKKWQKQVCFDFNFRPALNRNQNMVWVREMYEQALRYCDVVIGAQRDLEEILLLNDHESHYNFEDLTQHFLEKFDIQFFAGTKRSVVNNQRFLKGFVASKQGFFETKDYPVYVFDRIGTGDAYTAGLLDGILRAEPEADIVAFATASAILAHTTLGDSPVMSRKHIQNFLENENLDVLR